MAGLWDRWAASNGGPELYSCTVITTESNSSLGWLHDRLPCILEPSGAPPVHFRACVAAALAA
jgi:putative SOS response-associated peptidase YedK